MDATVKRKRSEREQPSRGKVLPSPIKKRMLENISQQQKKRRSQRILSNSVNMSARRSNVIGCRFQCDKITPTPTSYSKTLPVEVTVQKWNCLLGNTLNTISALGHSTILSQSERDTCLSKALRTTRLLPDDQNVNLGSVAYALQMHGYSYTISKKVSMECSLLQQYTIKYQFPLLVLLEMSYASGDKRQHLIGIVPIKVENEVCMHIVDGCHPEKKRSFSMKQIYPGVLVDVCRVLLISLLYFYLERK